MASNKGEYMKTYHYNGSNPYPTKEAAIEAARCWVDELSLDLPRGESLTEYVTIDTVENDEIVETEEIELSADYVPGFWEAVA